MQLYPKGAAIIGGNVAEILGIGGFGMIASCAVVGLILTTITGIVYNKIGIPSLVLSIGMCMVYEAVAQGFFGGQMYATRELTFIARAPYCFIVLIVGFAVMYLLINKTAFGRNLTFIGSNQSVARSTGVNIKKMKLLSFMLGGIFMGIAGAFMLANNATVTAPSSMQSLTVIFDAIMGVNIGLFLSKYCNMVVGVTVGTFTMRMLSIALVSVGLSSNIRDVITGIFLLLILCISANRGILAEFRARRANIQKADREYNLTR